MISSWIQTIGRFERGHLMSCMISSSNWNRIFVDSSMNNWRSFSMDIDSQVHIFYKLEVYEQTVNWKHFQYTFWIVHLQGVCCCSFKTKWIEGKRRLLTKNNGSYRFDRKKMGKLYSFIWCAVCLVVAAKYK